MEHPQKGTFCMSEALPAGEALIINLKAFQVPGWGVVVADLG